MHIDGAYAPPFKYISIVYPNTSTTSDSHNCPYNCILDFLPIRQRRKHPGDFASSQIYNFKLTEGATLDCHYRYRGFSFKPTQNIRSKF